MAVFRYRKINDSYLEISEIMKNAILETGAGHEIPACALVQLSKAANHNLFSSLRESGSNVPKPVLLTCADNFGQESS